MAPYPTATREAGKCHAGFANLSRSGRHTRRKMGGMLSTGPVSLRSPPLRGGWAWGRTVRDRWAGRSQDRSQSELCVHIPLHCLVGKGAFLETASWRHWISKEGWTGSWEDSGEGRACGGRCILPLPLVERLWPLLQNLWGIDAVACLRESKTVSFLTSIV